MCRSCLSANLRYNGAEATMAKRTNEVAWGLAILSLVAVVEIGVKWVGACIPQITILLPRGYVGWVRISYAVGGAPAIPIEAGHYLVKIPSSGILMTSTMPGGG